MHYRRWRRRGDTAILIPKVNDRRGPYTRTGCWEWQGATQPGGYGKVNVGGRAKRPHRMAYEAFYGPIPNGLFVCHRCDNPLCYRPDHLFLGTHVDNMEDMWAKGRAAKVEHTWRHLTGEQVRAIRGRLALGEIPAAIAPDFGVTRQTVADIRNGKTHKSVA